MTKQNTAFAEEMYPLAQSLIDYAMKEGKKYGITDVKINISSADKQSNTIENGEVAQLVSGTSSQISVVLYAGKKILSFSKNNFDEDSLKSTILENMTVINLVPENPYKGLLDSKDIYKGSTTDLNLYDNNQPSNDVLIDYAKKIETATLAQKGIKTARSISVSKNNNHSFILATNGLDFQKSTTMYQASVSAIAENENGMQTDGDYSIARHFKDMTAPENIGEEAGKNAVSKLDAILPETGEMSIVLNHDAAESFFSSVYSAIDGGAVYREMTFLKGKIGEQVMSKGITIVDDPTITKGISSQSTDTAGVLSEKITFIEDGILKAYNVNVTESRQLKIPPIGRENGPTNTQIFAGTQTPDELIADIDTGIYIKGFNGGSVDVNNGIHSRQAYGTLIKDGKITDIAVEGFVVSGNLKDMFMNIVLANDTPKLPNTKYTLAAPTTRINKVMIAGK